MCKPYLYVFMPVRNKQETENGREKLSFREGKKSEEKEGEGGEVATFEKYFTHFIHKTLPVHMLLNMWLANMKFS